MAPGETDDGPPRNDESPDDAAHGGESSARGSGKPPVAGDGEAAEGGDGDEEPVSEQARAFVHGLVAFGLTLLGVLATLLGAIPVLVYGGDTALGFTLSLLLGELGFVVVALGFLLVSRRGLGYLDLSLPAGHREWGLVVGFTAGAFVVRTLVLLGASWAGVQPAQSSIANVDLPMWLLSAILLPAMLLVVGPAEELLFRGVIQKYLREATSAPVAVVVAGLLFGSIHLLSLVRPSGLGTLVSLAVITAVGLGLGWLYERTRSLPAAMLAHGGYNALIVVSGYLLHVAGGGSVAWPAWLP